MPRLFAALEIPHDAALSLSLLRGGLPGARWIEAVDYHLTLCFFGDVINAVADEIVHALGRVTCGAFSLHLQGLDVFTAKKPHALYAGVAASPQLYALQAEIGRVSRRLGLSPEKRTFMPHVTLARLKKTPPDDLGRYLAARANFLTDPFTVSRFVLMSAKQSVGGGPYMIEEHWPLTREMPVSRAGP